MKSVKELVALAKARPGAINHSSAGVGTFTFLAAEMFKRQAGIDMLHVPYRAGGEALTAVIAGETSVYFSPAAGALPQIKQGRLRPLAVTSQKRIALMPELPTVAESGFANMAKFESGNWYGIVVPAKTPREIVDRVRTASVTTLNNPAINKRLQDLGFVLIGNTPEEFGAYFRCGNRSVGEDRAGFEVERGLKSTSVFTLMDRMGRIPRASHVQRIHHTARSRAKLSYVVSGHL